MKPLKSDTTKYEVVSLSLAGLSNNQISKKLGIPDATLSDFLTKKSHTDWWAKNEHLMTFVPYEPKICFIDIETSPLIAYVWGLYDQNISHNHIIEGWEILCVCYKWAGKDEVFRLNSSAMYLQNPDDAKLLGPVLTFDDLAVELWKVLDEADIIVAHNGVKFDNKKIRAKLQLAGLDPPSPYKVVDTLKICRSNFGFTSNRKDYLSKIMGGPGKHDTGGMQLWIDCLNGDFAAWQKMLNYCDGDVTELERIYMEVRAWDNKHPNLQVYFKDAEERCGTCSSLNIHPLENKIATTQTSAFEIMKCGDCGATKRRRKNTRTKEQMKNTLVNVS